MDRGILLAGAVAAGFIVYAIVHPERPPCTKVLRPVPAYLYDLELYREHRIQDEVEHADVKGGDRFDEEAARKRIMAFSEAQLDAERQSELAFAANLHEDVRKNCDPGK